MENIRFDTEGALLTAPSVTSSQHDFDFLEGKWDVYNRKLKTRLNGCNEWEEFVATQELRIILQGLGNTDQFITTINGKIFEGITLRLFNPVTRLWSIYWADSNMAVLDKPVVGSFHQGMGHFFTDDYFNGRKIKVWFQWDATDPEKPIWSQAFSADSGDTWEWNWYMYFSKAE
jgi:hypothetical protein